jgi:(E)-4-hydroxy-3-methylbut-2-enyl-diphosphate synthase
MERKFTRQIFLGDVPVGKGAPITVQSMTKTKTEDTGKTASQIRRLELAGCDIVRVAVPSMEAADRLPEILARIRIPLIADIHFDYRLAVRAAECGVQGLRINPGNIGSTAKVEAVVQKARDRNIPIRIGVNSGSLGKTILKHFPHDRTNALVASALEYKRLFEEEFRFQEIKFSLKSSDVTETIDAYRAFSEQCNYPLHLGITEAGTPLYGSVRSSVGIGTLLAEGIGDTIRISLAGDPVQEVHVGFEILKCLGLREHGPTVIACPTCGRCEIDLIALASRVEKRVRKIRAPLKIAVMGCEVNGPGEAKDADLGIAGGRRTGLLFQKGVAVAKYPEDQLLDAFISLVEEYAAGLDTT